MKKKPTLGINQDAQELRHPIINVKLPDSASVDPSFQPLLEIDEFAEYFCPSSQQLCFFDEKENMWKPYEKTDFLPATSGSNATAKLEIQVPHFTNIAIKNRRLMATYNLNDSFMDPSWNFDFTNVDDTGKTFVRGSEPYTRPTGWMRFGINVFSKYPDRKWIGTGTDAAVWPVAYHGTKQENVGGILQFGLQCGGTNGIAIANGNAHGNGINLTPDVEYAAMDQYTPSVMVDGMKLKVVLQVRIKGDGFQKRTNRVWLAQNSHDIRPYGILLKEFTN